MSIVAASSVLDLEYKRLAFCGQRQQGQSHNYPNLVYWLNNTPKNKQNPQTRKLVVRRLQKGLKKHKISLADKCSEAMRKEFKLPHFQQWVTYLASIYFEKIIQDILAGKNKPEWTQILSGWNKEFSYPVLREIYPEEIVKFHEKHWEVLFSHLPQNIRRVDLTYMQKIEKGIFLQRFSQLKWLNLTSSSLKTTVFLKNLKNLEELILEDVFNLDLCGVTERLEKLKKLNLAGVSNCKNLPKQLPNLKEITMNQIPAFDKRSFLNDYVIVIYV